jgi:hypothetical protein
MKRVYYENNSDLLEILKDIFDELKPVSPDEFIKATNFKENVTPESKHVLVNKFCNNGKIKALKIGPYVFPYLALFDKEAFDKQQEANTRKTFHPKGYRKPTSENGVLFCNCVSPVHNNNVCCKCNGKVRR